MTKKNAALSLLGVALSVSRAMAGDEDAEVWIVQLLWLASALDPNIAAHPKYRDVLGEGETRIVKLRRLIEHPSTPAPEREAAVAALARVRASVKS